MAAMEELTLTPTRQHEMSELQTELDKNNEPEMGDEVEMGRASRPRNGAEMPSEDLSRGIEDEAEMTKGMEAEMTTPRLRGLKGEVAELQAEAKISGIRGVRGQMTDGHITRNNQYTLMPFIVDQKNEDTCAYVTLSKVLIYNLLGLIMDIEVTYDEKMKLHRFMKSFPINSDVKIDDRDLTIFHMFSRKGYILILYFFYFFDFIKKNDLRPYYLPDQLNGVTELTGAKKGNKDFNQTDLLALIKYLKLDIGRLGGTTFTGNTWLHRINEELTIKARDLVWKKVTLCTLCCRFSTFSVTFPPNLFSRFCNEIILPITNQGIKVILTLFNPEKLFHDVMVVGMERDALLISNSWGSAIDIVPIELFPNVTFKQNTTINWFMFNFTFLLPFKQGDERLVKFKQINHDYLYYEDFNTIMKTYTIPTFDSPKLDPNILELPPPSGGKRKKRTRRNKSKYRNKKSTSKL
jgi:hypothetical protein